MRSVNAGSVGMSGSQKLRSLSPARVAKDTSFEKKLKVLLDKVSKGDILRYLQKTIAPLDLQDPYGENIYVDLDRFRSYNQFVHYIVCLKLLNKARKQITYFNDHVTYIKNNNGEKYRIEIVKLPSNHPIRSPYKTPERLRQLERIRKLRKLGKCERCGFNDPAA